MDIVAVQTQYCMDKVIIYLLYIVDNDKMAHIA